MSQLCLHTYMFYSVQILIGYMLSDGYSSDVRFDWLVGNMSTYQKNLFQSITK